MLTDKEGNIVWQDDFTPFGEETEESGFQDRDEFYTGKKIDRDTGLYYFNARWYDPKLGRFITEDPIKDGINWFSYVANNPLRYTDPTGLRMVKEDADEKPWWQKKEKVEGNDKRSLEVTTTQNPSNPNKTTQAVNAIEDGEVVNTAAYRYSDQESKNVYMAEGMVDDSQYGATALTLNSEGVLNESQGNTLPDDKFANARAAEGRYDYVADRHNKGKPYVGIGEDDYYKNQHDALRLSQNGTQNPMPGVSPTFKDSNDEIFYTGRDNTPQDTNYINGHAGNQFTGAGSEGCMTFHPFSSNGYIGFISNFTSGDKGYFDVFRY